MTKSTVLIMFIFLASCNRDVPRPTAYIVERPLSCDNMKELFSVYRGPIRVSEETFKKLSSDLKSKFGEEIR